MEPHIKQVFDDHKQKIIKTYIEWKIGVEVETEPVASPRICLEITLKALICKHFEITVFNKNNYNRACTEILNNQAKNKNQKKIILPEWKGTFGIELCEFLLESIEIIKQVNKEGIGNIQTCGNFYAHGVKKIDNKKLQKINTQLYEIVNLFFIDENESDWEVIHISPLIKKAAVSFTGHVAKEFFNIITSNEKQSDIEDIKPFDTSIDNYNILILPFRNPDDNYEISSLGKNLADGLKAKNELNNLGLEIKYISLYNGDITIEEARKTGNELKADIVIWGNDSKLDKNSSHQIYFHYVIMNTNIGSNKIPQKGITEKFESARLLEITEGKMHLEIDDIIHWFVGMRFYRKGYYRDALFHFKKMKYHKYQNEDLYFNMAFCYSNLHNYVQELLYLGKALTINQNFANAHHAMALLMSDIFNEKRKAGKHYKRALKINPKSWYTHNNYALLLSYKLNSKNKALYHFNEALKINSNFAFVHNNLATLLSNKFKDKDGAEYHYKKALEIDPGLIPAYVNYASFLSNKRNDKEGSEYQYKMVLEIDPNHIYVHLTYAILLVKNFNKKEEAKILLEKALEIDPQYGQSYFVYASILKKYFNGNDDKKKSKEYYLEAIRLNPSFKTFSNDVYFENSRVMQLLKKIFPFLFKDGNLFGIKMFISRRKNS